MFSNGMFILTSRSGVRYGAAVVAWLSQASFRPPLVMAAVRKGSRVFECLLQSGVAAIHVLGADQEGLHLGISIADGAHCQGRIDMQRPDPKEHLDAVGGTKSGNWR